MDKFKKSFAMPISLILTFIILFSGFSIISADSPADYKYSKQLNELELLFYNAISDFGTGTFSPDGATIEKAISNYKFTSTKKDIDEAKAEFITTINATFKTAVEYSNLDSVIPFWIDAVTNGVTISMSYSTNKNPITGIITITATITLKAFIKTVHIGKINSSINTLNTMLSSINVTGGTRYEKVKSINDLLCNMLIYKITESAHDIYGAIVDKKAVCEGYSRAFKYLCEREGIPCILVSGVGRGTDGSDPEAHMWNQVLMEDGKWYGVDVTWADQSDGVIYDFFLVGSDTKVNGTQYTFNDTHIANMVVTGLNTPIQFPQISKTAYDFNNVTPTNPTSSEESTTEESTTKESTTNESTTKESTTEESTTKESTTEVPITISTTAEPSTNKPTVTEESTTKAPVNTITFTIVGDRVSINKDDKIISSFSAGRSLREFFDNYDNLNIIAVNTDGDPLGENDVVGTGTIVTFLDNNNNILASYIFVILGDITGDGAVKANDARVALRHAVKIDLLEGAALSAADLAGNGKISASTARKILRAAVKIEAL